MQSTKLWRDFGISIQLEDSDGKFWREGCIEESFFRFIDGRYAVSLPWREDSHRMIKKIVMKRLKNIEKRKQNSSHCG